MTAFGNAQISTAIADPFGDSTGVIAFDGTDDYLTVAGSPDFVFGTGDFTVELWLYYLIQRTSITIQDFTWIHWQSYLVLWSFIPVTCTV